MDLLSYILKSCEFIENTLHGNLTCTEWYLACNGCSVSNCCLFHNVTLENANSKQPDAFLRFGLFSPATGWATEEQYEHTTTRWQTWISFRAIGRQEHWEPVSVIQQILLPSSLWMNSQLLPFTWSSVMLVFSLTFKEFHKWCICLESEPCCSCFVRL